jgi:hypothetical protein
MTGLVIVLASGLVHGLWAERWTPATSLQAAAARVEEVPLNIGDWNGTSADADPAAFAQAGARQYWARTYVDAKRNVTLLVILMCGRPGRMATHTPEVCYRGAGYEISGAPETVTMQAATGEKLGAFWTARFTKDAGARSDLRLYWGWCAGQGWLAPASPRWEFGGEPFLYKLYVSYDGPDNAAVHSDAVQDFFRHFLPALKETLASQDLRDQSHASAG